MSGGLTYSTIPKYRNILKIKHKLVNCKESAVSGYSYSSFIFIQFVLSLVFMDITALFLSFFWNSYHGSLFFKFDARWHDTTNWRPLGEGKPCSLSLREGMFGRWDALLQVPRPLPEDRGKHAGGISRLVMIWALCSPSDQPASCVAQFFFWWM